MAEPVPPCALPGLPQERRRRTLVAFAMQYGASVLNGAMSFIVIAVAVNRLDDARFSRLSTLLLQFSAYQICLDLGTHNLHVQRLSHLPRELWPHENLRLLNLRLLFSLLACAVALVHGVVAGFSSQMLWAFLIFVVGFIPASIVSVRDSFLFGAASETKAVWLRSSRILALASLAASVVFFPAAPLHMHFAVFTAVMLVAGVAAWHALAREGMLVPWSPKPKAHAHIDVARLDAWLALSYLTNAAFPIAINLVAVHLWGEAGLSLWNGAMTAATPLVLAGQTWAGLMARPYAGVFENPLHRHAVERRYVMGQLVLSAVGIASYVGLLYVGVFQQLLRRPEPTFAALVVVVTLWQCIWLLANMEILQLQFTRRANRMLVASLVSYVLGLLMAVVLGVRFHEIGLAAGLVLQGVLWVLVMRRAARKNPQSSAMTQSPS